MVRMLILVAALAACKSKSDPTPKSGSAQPPVAVVTTDAAVVAAKPHAQPTQAQLAEVKQHVKAGWAAQHDKKWADAVTQFAAALEILDGDARLLAELGWSAMNAGDFVTAKRADEAAVRAAVDLGVRAASLYNLGLVQLRLDDKLGAQRSFVSSLVLRPNKTVEAELAKLGDAPPAETRCATPCKCIEQTDLGPELEKCDISTEIKSPVAGWKVYAAKSGMDTGEYLFDEHDHLVAQIGGGSEHMRRYGHTTLGATEVRTVGGHPVLRIEVSDNDTTDSMGESSSESQDFTTDHTVYCAIGDAKTPSKCFDAPKHTLEIIDKTEIKDDGSPGAMSQKRDEVSFDSTIGNDGVVIVKLAKGSAAGVAPNVLGPHPLW